VTFSSNIANPSFVLAGQNPLDGGDIINWVGNPVVVSTQQ
jgi:hypothetical protein